MARMASILSPTGKVTKVSPGAGTSTAEQSIGSNNLVAIVATGDVNVKFGVTGMGAAAATDALIKSGVKEVYDMGSQFTHVRVFNGGAGSVDIYLQQLSAVS